MGLGGFACGVGFWFQPASFSGVRMRTHVVSCHVRVMDGWLCMLLSGSSVDKLTRRNRK
jgi:hypothetical protein